MRVRCREFGIAESLWYRWLGQYGGMKADYAMRLKELEVENGRLKRIVADQALDIDMLKHLNEGKMVTPNRCRQAVVELEDVFGVSQRRACCVVGQPRATQRLAPLELLPEE